MNTLSLRVRYRPVRIGWCIRSGNFDDLRKALRWTHIFWGGRYNPIIPIGEDTSTAEHLVRLYQVDILYPISDDKGIQTFIQKFPYLTWGSPYNKPLVMDSFDEKIPIFLDISHAFDRYNKEYPEHYEVIEQESLDVATLQHTPTLFSWDPDDPLQDFFLTTFGAFPSEEETGINYQKFFKEKDKFVKDKNIQAAKCLSPGFMQSISGRPIVTSPIYLWDFPSPSKVTTLYLDPGFIGTIFFPSGFYLGNVSNFDDLVIYWNLRAANINLILYDPNHAERLKDLKDSFLSELSRCADEVQKSDSRSKIWASINIWRKCVGENLGNKQESEKLSQEIKTYFPCDCPLQLNRVGQYPEIVPPLMGFKSKHILASLSGGKKLHQVAFELPPKQFFKDSRFYSQKIVVSMSTIDVNIDDSTTFKYPYFPELNDFYGTQLGLLHWYDARSEKDGIGIISDLYTPILTLNAVNISSLVEEIFKRYCMNTAQSEAGLVANRFFKQIQEYDNWIFKIYGVRKLLTHYSPTQHFSRNNALQFISEKNATRKDTYFPKFRILLPPNIFEKLKKIQSQPQKRYEAELKKELTKALVQIAFAKLVEIGALRSGLELKCTNCHLTFWISIDDLASRVECEFCGSEIFVSLQLSDGNWQYRKSGIFGRGDNQLGAIPVFLAICFLKSILKSGPFILYTTAMNLEPAGAQMNKCETDLVLITQTYKGRVQILIGECKGEMEIDENDVENLAKVANAFPAEKIDVFILFLKLSEFSQAEIDCCKKAQDQNRLRIIFLSNKELEADASPYAYLSETFKFIPHPISLADLAEISERVYFKGNRNTPWELPRTGVPPPS